MSKIKKKVNQENVIYTAQVKGNFILDGKFYKAGEKAGLSKEQVEKIMKARNLKNLVELKK